MNDTMDAGSSTPTSAGLVELRRRAYRIREHSLRMGAVQGQGSRRGELLERALAQRRRQRDRLGELELRARELAALPQ